MRAPYCHPCFAQAHSYLGRVVELTQSGSYAYKRELPGEGRWDASGLYPFWCFEEPEGLETDFAVLAEEGAISFVGVCSPLLCDIRILDRLADYWRPFKTHYLYDPTLPFQYDKHHRYELKQAQKAVQVYWTDLAAVLNDWCMLYAHLQARHGFDGVHAFPPSYFSSLTELPGLTVSVATLEGVPIAMHLWVDDGSILWSHLAASSPDGYRLRAGYALNAEAIVRYGQSRLINFGGAAGSGPEDDGLARFKRGFSNRNEFSWLFGKILSVERYAEQSQEMPETSYFPAYRQPGAEK